MMRGQRLALLFQMQQLLLKQRAAFDKGGTARLSESGVDSDLAHRHANLPQAPQEAQPFDVLRRVGSDAAALAYGIQQAEAFVVAQRMRTDAQLGSDLRNAGTHEFEDTPSSALQVKHQSALLLDQNDEWQLPRRDRPHERPRSFAESNRSIVDRDAIGSRYFKQSTERTLGR